jgi:hypothetical protein
MQWAGGAQSYQTPRQALTTISMAVDAGGRADGDSDSDDDGGRSEHLSVSATKKGKDPRTCFTWNTDAGGRRLHVPRFT